MNALGVLVLLAGPLLGVAWFISEFKGNRTTRIILGILAIVTLTTVAFIAASILNQLNYNAWYGFATKGLVDQTIEGIESGKTESVLRELRRFQSEYQPTYENRANYVPLAEETAKRMKDAPPPDADDGGPESKGLKETGNTGP